MNSTSAVGNRSSMLCAMMRFFVAAFTPQVQMDSALNGLLGEGETMDEESFEQSVMARLRSEGADGYHGFAKSVLTEIVEEREGRCSTALAGFG